MSDCPECDARLPEGTGGCKKCGWAPAVESAPPAKPAMLPLHRPFPERQWERSRPSDRCTEPGCTKLVSEHIAEFREAMRHIQARIGVTF